MKIMKMIFFENAFEHDLYVVESAKSLKNIMNFTCKTIFVYL